MKIFFDGGCQPNPGMMEAAVVAGGVLYRSAGLGLGTSHLAEWHALLHALEVARLLGQRDIVLLGDAANVIDHANRRAKCHGTEARDMMARYETAAPNFARVRLRHVRRGQNLAGIALEHLRTEALALAITGTAIARP